MERGREPGPGAGADPGDDRRRRAGPHPSHYTPRTRDGRIAVVLFVLLMALAQPPVVHGLADRIEPWILGLPFLYVYLLVVYSGLIAVLVWGMKRGL